MMRKHTAKCVWTDIASVRTAKTVYQMRKRLRPQSASACCARIAEMITIAVMIVECTYSKIMNTTTMTIHIVLAVIANLTARTKLNQRPRGKETTVPNIYLIQKKAK